MSVAATAGLTACSGDYAESQDAFASSQLEAFQPTALQRSISKRRSQADPAETPDGGASTSAPTQPLAATPTDGTMGELQSRQTADGETFDVVVPASDATNAPPAALAE